MAGLWDVLHWLLGVSSCRTGEAAGLKGELSGLTDPRAVLTWWWSSLAVSGPSRALALLGWDFAAPMLLEINGTGKKSPLCFRT